MDNIKVNRLTNDARDLVVEALNSSVIECKTSGKPMMYQTDGCGFFIACNDYPACSCCITLRR